MIQESVEKPHRFLVMVRFQLFHWRMPFLRFLRKGKKIGATHPRVAQRVCFSTDSLVWFFNRRTFLSLLFLKRLRKTQQWQWAVGSGYTHPLCGAGESVLG